jgi:hypothetical protein
VAGGAEVAAKPRRRSVVGEYLVPHGDSDDG